MVRKGFGNSSVKCMSNGFTRRCKGCACRSKPIFVSVKPLFVVWCVKMWILYYGDGKSATDYFKYLDGVLCL